MKKFGIDISSWQNGFDFDRAKSEGVEFAILRGAYHTRKDNCFDGFYAACKERNIPIGVYLYSMAKTVAEAKEEANLLIYNVLKGKRFEYPIYMDVEDKTQAALGKDLLTEVIVAFCETLESAGYYAGIYSTANFLKSYTHESRLADYDKWIAQWSSECTYTGDYGMWQFGGEVNRIRSNKVAGVVCDQDYALKDYPAIICGKKLNGYWDEPVERVQLDPAKNFESSYAGAYKVNSLIGLKLRTGAGITKKILETMPNKSFVMCYGYHTGSWLFVVSASGKEGFCHKSYLRKV